MTGKETKNAVKQYLPFEQGSRCHRPANRGAARRRRAEFPAGQKRPGNSYTASTSNHPIERNLLEPDAMANRAGFPPSTASPSGRLPESDV